MHTAPDPLHQLRGLVPLLEPDTAFRILDALVDHQVQVVTDTPERRVWVTPGVGAIGLHRPTGALVIDTDGGIRDAPRTRGHQWGPTPA